MTIYIGNIPFACNETKLFELLSRFGSILDLHYPIDQSTGQKRGFAFVTLPDRDVAEEAIRTLDGSLLEGRTLRVSEAKAPDRPSEQGSPVGFRRQGENPFGFGQRRR